MVDRIRSKEDTYGMRYIGWWTKEREGVKEEEEMDGAWWAEIEVLWETAMTDLDIEHYQNSN